MIDIIIPAYNAHKTLPFTLMSIDIQTFKSKTKIYIVDDCSEENYDNIIKDFQKNLDISLLKTPQNLGSGLARQYGIDNSNNDYILFLDSDDLFYDADSLKKLYLTITENNLQYVASYCFNEAVGTKNINFSDLHGKIYKRSFLEQKAIKFNETRFHEDNAFNNLVLLHEPSATILQELTYIYCNNTHSITKVSAKIEFSRLKIFIYNIRYVIDIAKKHNCNNFLIKEYVYNKLKYLRKIYHESTKEEKTKIKLWLYKYNLNYIKYLSCISNNLLRINIMNADKI